MATLKKFVSLQAPLYAELEAAAQEMHISRSEALARAVRDFLDRNSNRRPPARLRAEPKEKGSPDAKVGQPPAG